MAVSTHFVAYAVSVLTLSNEMASQPSSPFLRRPRLQADQRYAKLLQIQVHPTAQDATETDSWSAARFLGLSILVSLLSAASAGRQKDQLRPMLGVVIC